MLQAWLGLQFWKSLFYFFDGKCAFAACLRGLQKKTLIIFKIKLAEYGIYAVYLYQQKQLSFSALPASAFQYYEYFKHKHFFS